MGPLAGTRIVELGGIGAAPFCGMMLTDMGATVVRVDRPGSDPSAGIDQSVLFRNRRSLALDLKQPEGARALLRLCENADAVFEGFRPGVAERLGVGPNECMGVNPRLVYGRMTGWGRTGPLAPRAGHDINYIALSGALHAIGRREDRPVPPLNLVGDFGGGGLMLAFGLVCALLEARESGRGQVVDSAMVDGAAALTALFHGRRVPESAGDERGTHLLDTGAPFYEVYETADGQHISIGAIEPQFHALMEQKLGLDPIEYGNQMDTGRWPEQKEKLAALFKQKTRDQWCEILADTDVCFAPVLSLTEALHHPHNRARGNFVDVAGKTQPAPTPRFSRTRPQTPSGAHRIGADTRAVLAEAGLPAEDIDALVAQGIAAEPATGDSSA